MSVPVRLAQEATIAADDRGLNYGDGLFETLRIHAGQPLWWGAHWQRLSHGARALGIATPSPESVLAACEPLLAQPGDGVLKLLLTRGSGGRGYAPPEFAQPQMILSLHPLPKPFPATGLHLRWCTLRLGIQPLLAGLKHCNRLEHVLARAECSDPAIHEGLLCDAHGAPTCATAANLFVLRGGNWLTPLLDRAGVAGICRQWLLAQGIGRECRLTREHVDDADAIFLCNAVRGILPVARLDARRFEPHPEVRRIVRLLARAEPAFAAMESA